MTTFWHEIASHLVAQRSKHRTRLMGDGIGMVYRHNRLDAADMRPVLRMTEKI